MQVRFVAQSFRLRDYNLGSYLLQDLILALHELPLFLYHALHYFLLLDHQAIQAALQDDADRLVVIRADKSIQHKKVIELISRVKASGAQHIAIATEQRSRTFM